MSNIYGVGGSGSDAELDNKINALQEKLYSLKRLKAMKAQVKNENMPQQMKEPSTFDTIIYMD